MGAVLLLGLYGPVALACAATAGVFWWWAGKVPFGGRGRPDMFDLVMGVAILCTAIAFDQGAHALADILDWNARPAWFLLATKTGYLLGAMAAARSVATALHREVWWWLMAGFLMVAWFATMVMVLEYGHG